MDVHTFNTKVPMNAEQYRELIERYRISNPRKYAIKREEFEKKLAQLEGRVWPPVVEPVEPQEEKETKPVKAKKVVENEEGK